MRVSSLASLLFTLVLVLPLISPTSAHKNDQNSSEDVMIMEDPGSSAGSLAEAKEYYLEATLNAVPDECPHSWSDEIELIYKKTLEDVKNINQRARLEAEQVLKEARNTADQLRFPRFQLLIMATASFNTAIHILFSLSAHSTPKILKF